MITAAQKNTFMTGVANDFRNELVRTAPVNTGFLKNNIVAKVVEDGIEITMPYYALHVEFGTAPHIIEPKDAKALHWKKDGKHFFAKKVMHPGTQSNPFIRNAIRNKLKTIVKKNFERHMS